MIAYRARVYQRRSQDPTETAVMVPAAGAPTQQPFQVSSVRGLAGYLPVLQVVRGRKGRIDFLEKKVDTGTLKIKLLDRRLTTANDTRLVTAFLADANGIEQLRGAKMQVDEALDYDLAAGTGTWTNFFTGRIETAEQEGALTWTITIRDIRDELDSEVFTGTPHASATSAFLNQIWPLGLSGAFGDHPVQGPLSCGVDTVATSWFGTSSTAVRLKFGKWDVQAAAARFLNQAVVNLRDDLTLAIVQVRPDSASPYEDYELAAVESRSGGFLNVPDILEALVIRALPGGAALPTVGGNYEARIAQNPARIQLSESTPLVIGDVHPVTLMRWLCLGYFGRIDSVSGDPIDVVPHHAASFAALEADTSLPSSRFVITAGAKRAEFIEKHICQPNGLGYRINPSGELEVLDLRRPTTMPAGTKTIRAADLLAKPDKATFGGSRSTAVTRVDYEMTVDRSLVTLVDYKGVHGILDMPSTLLQSKTFTAVITLPGGAAADRANDVKPKTVKIEAIGARYRYTPPATSAERGSTPNELFRAVQLRVNAERVSEELRGPHTAGASFVTLHGGRTPNVDVKQGELVIVDVDVLPNAATNKRGGQRLMRVLGREEDGPELKVQAMDLGESGTAVAPSITSAVRSTSRPYDAIDLTVALNATGELAVAHCVLVDIGAARPVDSDPGWFFAERWHTGGLETIAGIPSGKRAYFRLRTEPSGNKGWKLPSAWVYSAAVDMLVIAAPTGLAMQNIRRNDAELIWTPSDDEALTDVFLALGAGAALDSEDFTKADGPLPAGWSSFNGTHGVESNEARVLTSTSNPIVAIKDCGLADVLVEIVLADFPAASVISSTYLILRGTDGDNFIFLRLDTWTWLLTLGKRVGGGALQTVDSMTISPISPGQKLSVRGNGTTVEGGVDGQFDLGGTINEFTSATKHGFAGSSGAVAISTNRWDQYRVFPVNSIVLAESDRVITLPPGSKYFKFFGLDGPAVLHTVGVRHRDLNGGVSPIAGISFSTTNDVQPVCPVPNGFKFITPNGPAIPIAS